MKLDRHKVYFVIGAVAVVGSLSLAGHRLAARGSEPSKKEAAIAAGNPSVPGMVTVHKPKYVRGIHLTSWVAGSSKLRATFDQLLDETEINTVVIDIKEYEGEVYIPGVKLAEQYKTYVKAIPDLEKYVARMKSRGIYTVARVVVFKDNIFPRRKPSAGVKDAAGNLWKDRKGITWLDPYSPEAWSYNLDIAERALDLGFEEIQFDYIRFPSDGAIGNCRYSQHHSSTTANTAIVGFLKEANRRLKPRGANISIDVFGLTTTVTHDMGIGQKMMEMAEWVDFLSPMVYPSHYAKGEYRIPDPNKAPYKTVYLSLEGAMKRLGAHGSKLRPYLQDFSLGYHYGAKEVRDQIQAAYDNDIGEWLLWNPRCVYTRTALKGKEAELTYEKKAPPAGMFPSLEQKAKKTAPPVAELTAPTTAAHATLDKSTTEQSSR